MPLHQLFGFFFFSLLLNSPYLSTQVFLAFVPLIVPPTLLGDISPASWDPPITLLEYLWREIMPKAQLSSQQLINHLATLTITQVNSFTPLPLSLQETHHFAYKKEPCTKIWTHYLANS